MSKNLEKFKIFLFLGIMVLTVGGFFAYQKLYPEHDRRVYQNTKNNTAEFKNFILVGWDGADRDVLYELLHEGKLPNLEKLIAQGTLSNTTITAGKTETKPVWTQILTGYTSEITGVYSNLDYKPIPKGYSIFERLKDHFGKENIATLFVGGKIVNIGARGPHKICMNCFRRDPDTRKQLVWWDEHGSAPTKNPGAERIFEEREGDPFYHAKSAIDLFEVSLRSAANVGPKVLNYLEKYKDQRFFAFFHFEEPDEPGHQYGRDSKEYRDGIITDDYWLGKIILKLKELGIYEETLIYVTSDHGFDKVGFNHLNAPNGFLATNDSEVIQKEGDTKDITPTILDRYGIDIKSITPPMAGVSLIKKGFPEVTFVVREFLSDGPAMIADELGYYADEGLNVKTVIVEKGEYASPLLLSGKAQFAILGDKWSPLTHLKDTNKELEIIADLGGGGKRWRVMARKDSGITTLQDLNAKKVGSWLDSYGFARFSSYLKEKNISIIPIQLLGMAPKTALDTLARGDVDAVLVWEPVPSLIEENNAGYQIFTMEEIGNEMSIFLHARRNFVQEYPQVTQKVLKALQRGQEFIRDNPEKAARIISSKFLILPAPPSAVQKGLSYIDFAVRFDENEEEQMNYIIKIFQEAGLHNLPDKPFMKLNGEYIK